MEVVKVRIEFVDFVIVTIFMIDVFISLLIWSIK